MLWGCMSTSGVGYACRIDGRMDTALYVEILSGELMQSLAHFGMEVEDIIFQHDNDPKHVSNLARRWLTENEVEVLDWPAQSPDLNPIEHLWHHLKRRLSNYESEPKSIHELWVRVETEWDKIPTNVCKYLIDTMPARISAVLKAKGGYTKY